MVDVLLDELCSIIIPHPDNCGLLLKKNNNKKHPDKMWPMRAERPKMMVTC